MSIELEYAVKKDIRNNSVVRQADVRQRAELRSMLVVGAVVFGVLLLSAWQQFAMFDTGVRIEKLRGEHENELSLNRQLQLNLAFRRAPEELARRAQVLGLRPATLGETLVIERIHQPDDAASVVASAR
jgi:hypothetical protein